MCSFRSTYGTGYTYFNEGRYNEACSRFELFIKVADKNDRETISDAYNRIADCYFYQREYKTADQYYKMSIAADSSACDFPLYRSALAQGLSGKYQEKVNTLNTLLEKYPNLFVMLLH